jgi:hypothetical protein
MSKGTPPTTSHVNQPNFIQPIYVQGEKVYYTFKGVQLPCIVTNVQQVGLSKDANGVTYTVTGDIRGTSYPTSAPRGPFKGIALSALTDRP